MDRNYGYSDNRNTYDLKTRGHEIIDKLVTLGTGRTQVYQTLGRRLGGGQKRAHFSNMSSHNEVARAVTMLEDILIRRQKKMEKKGKRKAYKHIVPIDRALLREVGERNRAAIARAAETPSTLWSRLLTGALAPFRRW
jgi:hypothetical protein